MSDVDKDFINYFLPLSLFNRIVSCKSWKTGEWRNWSASLRSL